jgi:hypothetical protein
MAVAGIPYTASTAVADAIAALGRTEDVRFSPNNQRLALAALARDRIVVFDIDITSTGDGAHIALTAGLELSSPALRDPHGVDFIDDDTVIVTSRGSGVAVFTLPSGTTDVRSHAVLPIASWPAAGTDRFAAPGSVVATRVDSEACEVLICNNGRSTVTRHRLDRSGAVLRWSDVLLKRYLDIPDGVAVSTDRRWIAVSNHNTYSVLVYENLPGLTAESEPDGILRRVYYPHGLSFSEDGRYLFVADAGAPFLHIYAQDSDEWRGVRYPVATVRVMSDAVFRKGRHSRAQGGPKGLDLDAGSKLLVVTSEFQPLAFFDVPGLVRCALAGTSEREQKMLDKEYEVALLQERALMARRVTEVADAFQNSRSWRLTAPLRQLGSALRRRTS